MGIIPLEKALKSDSDFVTSGRVSHIESEKSSDFPAPVLNFHLREAHPEGFIGIDCVAICGSAAEREEIENHLFRSPQAIVGGFIPFRYTPNNQKYPFANIYKPVGTPELDFFVVEFVKVGGKEFYLGL